MANLRVARHGKWSRLLPSYAGLLLTGSAVLGGVAAAVEMLYRLQFSASSGTALVFAGLALDAARWQHWVAACAVAVLAGLPFEALRRRFARQWRGVQAEIADIEMEQSNMAASLANASEMGASDIYASDMHPSTLAPPTLAPSPAALPTPACVPALELREVGKSFGKTQIIRNLNLCVARGQRVALIGPNGAGKSTLFDLISGRLAPSSGDVLLNGCSIVGRAPFDVNRLGMARSFQISNLFGSLSVFENLRCGVLWSLGYRYTFLRLLSGLHDANARANALVAQLGLAHKPQALAMNLTYAEQRALEVGMAIAGGANLVLLDEPTAGMSASETSRFVALIARVTEGKTLLTVEHDMGVVFGLADKIAVLVQGEIIAFDSPEAVRANPRVQEAYLGIAQPLSPLPHSPTKAA
jgi:branched-chain amino acid transport system ATP-binding protein